MRIRPHLLVLQERKYVSHDELGFVPRCFVRGRGDTKSLN
jgi:hypothetical protein